jgi:tetratricopeptide (TPR) repeat protein
MIGSSWGIMHCKRYLLLLVVPLLAQGQGNDLRFSEHLMREGDYFRAITEYKRVLFFAGDDSIKDHCLLQIAKAYRRSGKFELAIENAAAVLMTSAASPALRFDANVSLGMCYLEANMPQLALQYFTAASQLPDTTRFARLCVGVVKAETRDYEGAGQSFGDAGHQSALVRLRTAAEECSALVKEYSQRPQFSSTVAATLSSVLPGAGQLYSGHTYDALQAFLYTGSMTLAAIAVYRYERSVSGHLGWTYVGITVAGMFHLSNIIGAARTAEYRNWKTHTDMTRQLREILFRHEP